MLKRSAVSAVIHDVEMEVHELQLVGKRHSAVKQIQVAERKNLDFVPAKFVDVELDKVSASSPNPLNQCMRVELKGGTVFHGVVIDPVDQFFSFNNSGQRVVVRIANVRRRL
jgi:hypothetical protein